MTLPLLKVGPPLAARKESVELKELGGSVIVRGLLASEVFAVVGIRTQALRRLRAEQRSHVDAEADGGAMQAPPSTDLEFAEMVQYGTHVSHLLALAVQGEGGLALYTVDEWEVFASTIPQRTGACKSSPNDSAASTKRPSKKTRRRARAEVPALALRANGLQPRHPRRLLHRRGISPAVRPLACR